MANYTLKVVAETEYGLLGMAFDENENVLTFHVSSDVLWLENDLLRDIGFDPINDTYTFEQ